MIFSGRLRVLAAFVPAVAVQLAFGCSAPSTTETFGRTSAPIIGGVADTTHTWTVGIDVGGAGICSGTLIAPNLVLTARHCVSQTPTSLDCRPDAGLSTNKVLGNYPASAFRVTTAQKIGNAPIWTVRAVRYIDDPAANTLCGYDLALLELQPNSSGLPTSWVAPSLVPPSRTRYIAIGYGCQNALSSSGGGCDPRGYRMMLDPVVVLEVTAKEFVIQGRVCGGDSGGPLWSEVRNAIFGALSRGDGTTSAGEGCNYGIYTRADAHLAWLQKYGKMAAAAGGYPPPEWMNASTTKPDAGPTPAPEKLANGATCSSPSECASNLCVEFGTEKLCSSRCSDAAACSSGFDCNDGFCYPRRPKEDAGAPEDDAGAPEEPAAAPSNDAIKGGCSTGARDFPPPRPVPWIAVALVGLGLRRRRAR